MASRPFIVWGLVKHAPELPCLAPEEYYYYYYGYGADVHPGLLPPGEGLFDGYLYGVGLGNGVVRGMVEGVVGGAFDVLCVPAVAQQVDGVAALPLQDMHGVMEPNGIALVLGDLHGVGADLGNYGDVLARLASPEAHC